MRQTERRKERITRRKEDTGRHRKKQATEKKKIHNISYVSTAENSKLRTSDW